MRTGRVLGLVLGVLVVAGFLHADGARAAGNTIVALDHADIGSNGTSLVLDAGGNPLVAYTNDQPREPGLLTILRCADPHCRSGTTIVSPGGHASDVSLALDAEDRPVVAYHDYVLKLLRCGTPTCSDKNSVVTIESTPEGYIVGAYPSLALDSAGNPVMAYQGPAERGLRIVHCGNPTCSGVNTVMTPDGELGGAHTALQLDSDGNPVVSYFGRDNGLKVLHCGDPTCSKGNLIASPDAGPGRAGLWSSLALDSVGNPVVSYYAHYPNYDLRVLHCGGPDCTSGNTIASPNTEGDVGAYTSIALDADGHPVVSYRDQTNYHLKLLHCGDANCSADNVITAPDSTRFAGAATSLVLSGEGLPIVSYHGAAYPIHVRLLHCGDQNCAVPAYGDASCDGVTSSIDALVIMQFALGVHDKIPCVPGADVNLDGVIDALDALIILQLEAGLITSLPP